MTDSEVAELIKRRRLQILVTSCAYEECNASLISDEEWDKRAKELACLQDTYRDVADGVAEYKEDFQGWTGDTGAGLPLRDTRILNKTWYLIQTIKRTQ